MDSLLNPLASQDHIPLGITCCADRLLELEATLLYPVSLHIIMIQKDQLTTSRLVEGCNFGPTLCPIGQKLFDHHDQGIHHEVGLPLTSGHVQHQKRLIAEYFFGQQKL
jgi:hypothetical protein